MCDQDLSTGCRGSTLQAIEMRRWSSVNPAAQTGRTEVVCQRTIDFGVLCEIRWRLARLCSDTETAGNKHRERTTEYQAANTRRFSLHEWSNDPSVPGGRSR